MTGEEFSRMFIQAQLDLAAAPASTPEELRRKAQAQHAVYLIGLIEIRKRFETEDRKAK